MRKARPRAAAVSLSELPPSVAPTVLYGQSHDAELGQLEAARALVVEPGTS
jgi:hypothetical protein